MDQARLRPAQVGASTAAAVGGAFLASRLGVYGTIIGVGVITLMSTVGSEMLLRSLERTKQAARTATPRMRIASQPGSTAAMPTSAPDEVATIERLVTAASVPPEATTEYPTTAIDDSETATIEQPVTATLSATPAASDDGSAKARRWPLVAGGFLASFGLALAVIAGIEAFTGQSLDGDGRPTVLNVIRGADQDTDPSAPITPTDESTDAPEDGGTSPSEPDDATRPQPDPATSPSQSPPPDGEDESPQPGEQTPAPGEEVTPPPEEEMPPEEEETTPPPEEDKTSPTDDGPTPAP